MGVIVITQADRPIGAATAHVCARRGMGVILTCAPPLASIQSLVEVIQRQGAVAVALELNVDNFNSFDEFRTNVARALDCNWRTQTLDGMVWSAEQGRDRMQAALDPVLFDELVSTHLQGPYFLSQALLPLMREGASIVNINSEPRGGLAANDGPRAACGRGLEALTRAMAVEFGAWGIRVNAVSPGAVRAEPGAKPAELIKQFESLMASRTALGRVGEANEIARVVAMLLTQDADWINGQTINACGGYSA